MLRKLIAAACFALLAFAAAPSQAQQAIPITTCGTLDTNLTLGIPHALYMDTTGKLCTSGAGGGGAGDASAANQTAVQTPVAPATATATKGNLIGGTYNSTLPTFTNGQQGGAQFDSRGRLITYDDQVLAAVNSAIPAGTNLIGDVNVRQGGTALSAANPLPAAANPYPVGAVPYTATATGTTGATTATLAGAASVTTYICGFSIRANATAAATGNATVTGVITATLNFTQWTAPNASGLGITEMIFAPCIPASGTNQSVAVVSAAPGTGGVVSVTAWGYKL